ncbi:hypothetical protein HPP92_027338 [Vanilla planifolia]|uniref:Uncharacterized protein n=1 Tax=Vanilla planifolia TaxID=51239 RepID=A0A835PC97_VANPL|nr:hypothetical protein HPP92_027338 [Vanilla planifolia]
MAKKKKTTRADSGGLPPASDPSPIGNVENLKRLNSHLVDEVEKLRSVVAGAAGDFSTLSGIELDVSRLVLSNGVADVESRCASIIWQMEAERNVSLEKSEALQVKVDLGACKVREMEMRLLAEGEEKLGIQRKLDRALAEKNSMLSDLVEKRKKLEDLEKRVLQTEQGFEQANAERDVAEEDRRMLEDKLKKAQELQSVQDENIRLGICLQDRTHLMAKLTAEMEDMRRGKESEMVTLKAEIKANAEKLSTLEERCLQLEEIRNKLQSEVSSMQGHLDELKKDNAEVVNCLVDSSSAEKLVTELEQLDRRKESEKMHLEAENIASVAKLSTLEEIDVVVPLEEISCPLLKEVDSLKACFDELKEKLISCLEDVEKSNVKLEEELERTRVELSQARKETSAIQNASMLMVRQLTLQRKKLRYGSKLVSAQKELNHKAEEVSALRLQVDELMKANLEEKHALNSMFVANDEKQGLVDSLTSKKASLEKKLKVLEMASERALSLLKETAEEVALGHLRTEEKKDESGFELDDDGTLQPFVEELKAIKVALMRRVTKDEDMNRDMEVLQLSVEEAEKSQGGVLKWLCPAATAAFAVVSLVYAARRS